MPGSLISEGFGGILIAATTGDLFRVNKSEKEVSSRSMWRTAPGNERCDSLEGGSKVWSESPLRETGEQSAPGVYHFMIFTIILISSLQERTGNLSSVC